MKEARCVPRPASLPLLLGLLLIPLLPLGKPSAARGAEGKVLLLPFQVSSPDSPVAWMGSALPRHILNQLVRQGLAVETVAEPAAAPHPMEAPVEEVAAWLATREAIMVIGGQIQESTAAVRVNGRIVTADGAAYLFSFPGKLADLPTIIPQTGSLALEILSGQPSRRLWPLQMAPPRLELNHRELGLGSVPSPSEFAQSETLYKTAIKVDPNNADAYYQLGTLYGRVADWKNSLANFEESVKKSPKYVKYHIGLGLAYFLSGRLDEALGEFVQVSMLDDHSAEAYYDLSVIYRETGDLAKAETSLQQAAAADPAYPLLKLGAAMIRHYRGETEEAARELQQLLADNPRVSEAHNNLGVISLEGGATTAEAIKMFQRALAADEGNLTARMNIAVAQLQEGKVVEAIGILEEVRSISPNFAPASYNLGCSRYRTGKLQEALGLFAKALEDDPRLAEAMVNIGVAQFLLAEFESAQRSLEQATTLDGAPALAHFNLGVLHHTFGRREEALAEYLKTNKMTHRIPAAHINLGALYEEMGQDSKALNEYLKALSLTTAIPEVYLSLGTIYYKLGYQELAFETMKKATMVSFSDPAGYYFLGRLFETTDASRAADYYKTFLDNIERDPNRGALWRRPMEEKLRELGR